MAATIARHAPSTIAISKAFTLVLFPIGTCLSASMLATAQADVVRPEQRNLLWPWH
jgi:hypothetical protein